MCNWLLSTFFFAVASLPAAGAGEFPVDSLPLRTLSSGWGQPVAGKAIGGGPLKSGSTTVSRGIGTHAPSSLLLSLDGKATRFRARVGIDANQPRPKASVEFRLIGDGKELWSSGILRDGQEPVACDVDLTGLKSLIMVAGDGGDGNDSDHANWLEPVIVHGGLPPVEWSPPPPHEHPLAPPNAVLTGGKDSSSLEYAGHPLLALPPGAEARVSSSTGTRGELTQSIQLRLPTAGNLVVHAGNQAIAAETLGKAQNAFPLVRTSHGLSSNLRNNAIYDRGSDWMLEAPEGSRIQGSRAPNGSTIFTIATPSTHPTLVFRPRFFQKHRNLVHYEPWTYEVRRDSITGWSSWWTYMRDFRENHLHETLKVWREKRFADYGYRFIQIDDVFQGRYDDQRSHAKNSVMYIGGHPDTWLDWRLDRFPSGLDGYCRSVREAGFLPAIWMGCFFSDNATAAARPDWFVRGADGQPFPAPWSSYAVDMTNPEAVETLIRPTFRGLRAAGLDYVKIDQLRHMLYDNFHRNPQWFAARGIGPADLFRAYLRVAREELGRETFILSCWGVLPESIGLADACRIGGDGYGPVTLQQYNSFNGLVWLNDPDHCDVLPKKAAAEAGNVRSTTEVEAVANDTLIRPALASIAGAMLMLTDAPAVYQDDRNLLGLRKSSPVVSSVPGQLYDFDPAKTNVLRDTDRFAIQSGTQPSPVDADQHGFVCPFWLNEFNNGFDHWSVLHRLNWSTQPAGIARIQFANLGLDPAKSYLVHEFWSDRTLGIVKDGFESPALDPMGIQSFAIRELLDHPQIVTTNRHLSQGAAEIEMSRWDAESNTLEGRSRIVAGDDYRIRLHVPRGYRLVSAELDRRQVAASTGGGFLSLPLRVARTGSYSWSLRFEK